MQNLVAALYSDRLSATSLGELEMGQYDSLITGLRCTERRKRFESVAAVIHKEEEVVCEEEEAFEKEEVTWASCHFGKGASQQNRMMTILRHVTQS